MPLGASEITIMEQHQILFQCFARNYEWVVLIGHINLLA
jgi:hypothetical protein